MTKTEEALDACKKILDGIELGTLAISAAALLCLRIARLLNDTNSIYWLQCETGGYPREANGHIIHKAWEAAYTHGRGGYNKDKQQVVFSDLVSELESEIINANKAIGNFSTAGVSASGDHAPTAMRNLTSTVSSATGQLLERISNANSKIARAFLSIFKTIYFISVLFDVLILTSEFIISSPVKFIML